MALSVPLRGLWFLSCLNGPYIQLSMFWCFPSPCGDYGSYLTILRNTRVRVLLSVPLRGLWFLSTTGNKPFIIIITLLSVPLRGLWFLSVCSTLYIAIYKALSFRPLAGIMVLIGIHFLRKAQAEKIFPSPCGDYGSYQYVIDGIAYTRILSVPLRGLWFLSPTQSFRGYYQSGFLSVPLRGLWFLSLSFQFVIIWLARLSVPLRGLWFLSNCKRGSRAKWNLSVPLRGLWFLSTDGRRPP